MRPLQPRLDLREHGATDFAWGCMTGAAMQLALALLADATGRVGVAVLLHRIYCRDVLRPEMRDMVRITAREIRDWVDEFDAAWLKRALTLQGVR